MVFSSISFIFYFLPPLFLAYFLFPSKWRNPVLVIFSLIFYTYGEPIFVCIMLLSTIVDYTVGRLIEENYDRRKLYLSISIVCNISLLLVFKYADFLISILNDMLSINLPLTGLPLPIGISFYTFQTMSYSIDVYRGEIKAQKKFYKFLLYTSLFPQLIAGPIVRYKDVANEIDKRYVTIDDFSHGFERFILGLGKKVLLANPIGLMADTVFNNAGNNSFLTSWFGALAFSIQIYFDFSGYSDMAIGLGRMFGFHFPENFDNPYISCSITEFWRRWHMSLGTWFRDYVYIPLGGNKVCKLKQIRNLFVVWSLTGIWHGAALGYLAWGLYMFIFIALEKYFFNPNKKYNILRNILTSIILIVGWVFFKCEQITLSIEFLKDMFDLSCIYDGEIVTLISENMFAIPLAVICCLPINKWYLCWKTRLNRSAVEIVEVCESIILTAIFALCIIMLVNESYNPFLYFRF